MNKRIFIQKKSAFDIPTDRITKELKNLVPDLACKVFIVYDLFNITDTQLEKVEYSVFADPVTDIAYRDLKTLIHQAQKELLPSYAVSDTEMEAEEGLSIFATEYLPGQYNQREDSAQQCLQLINVEEVTVKSGSLYVFNSLTEEELTKVKTYLINPIESREKDLNKIELPKPIQATSIPIIREFIELNAEGLEQFYSDFGFAIEMDDLEFIQQHFQSLNRNPTETELKVLDTYWSDHCRHTTFETELTDIQLNTRFKETLQATLDYYFELRSQMSISKPARLMDLATIMGKYLSKTGKINNIDISEEVNACSIVVPVDVDGEEEEWLLQFKNETHNHPTEVEPFGGASTCIGGAIRDPLSGRAYVFQAMRISGAANPLEDIKDTLEGKLPQRKITKEAATGYSSYGNQIGVATTFVKEIYDEGYKAKRMEVGFVAGAVKKEYVRREEPFNGDKIILLGGATGRDGVGGATGSSKTHDGQDLEDLSAEVQKGNAIVERKIQRLFRNPKALALIKRCNDFGAGGVSVAIGEIARGVSINLDKVPLKYVGLNGTELAISESQERMAVVVEAKDAELFIKLAELENLEATSVAEVTDQERMLMSWKGDTIVNLDRKFLDSNGVRKQMSVEVIDGKGELPFKIKSFTKETYLSMLSNLNHCSQKGLIEMFDANVGRSTVLNPLGGKTQDTPEDVSVQKFPTDGVTQTVSMASYGFDPKVSRWSAYHGAYYSVIDSITKIVSAGGDYRDIRLTFQEYFESLKKDPQRWGKPFAALLGSIEVQRQFEIPAIGGKDSMSGSFQDLDVPPTLISFAVAPSKVDRVVSATLTQTDAFLSVFIPPLKEDYTLDTNKAKQIFQFINGLDRTEIDAMMTVKSAGIAETLTLMAFGNEIGFSIETELELMLYNPASIIIAHKAALNLPKEIKENCYLLGKTNTTNKISFNTLEWNIREIKSIWKETLSELFPYAFSSAKEDNSIYSDLLKKQVQNINISPARNQKGKPKVFIPVFPGTNSEYDSIKAFRKEGAKIDSLVFNNLSQDHIQQSVDAFVDAIERSQILFIPGGFGAADEPDGSGKFIATVLRNEKIRDSIHELLARDGLVLGICNGFQALIKSGLLPFGKIQTLNENAPTLTFNKIGRHIAQLAKIKVTANTSPWLNGMQNQSYWLPFSHGEGRFIANEKEMKELISNGQIATQFVDLEGKLADEMPFNPNGSQFSIEGITSPCGKVFGRMGHPERFEEGLMKNIPEIKYMNIFKNGVDYFL